MSTPSKLHVFEYRDCDCVVASSVEDAWAGLCEQMGDSFRDDEGIEGDAYWEQLPDESELSIWCDADGGIAQVDEDGAEPVSMTCSEWARRCGRGFLASTEQ